MLLADANLDDATEAFAHLPMVLNQLLARSFPVPGGADEIRQAFAADIGASVSTEAMANVAPAIRTFRRSVSVSVVMTCSAN